MFIKQAQDKEQISQPLDDTLAEWLRRQPAKLVGSARASSNLVGVDFIFAASQLGRSSQAHIESRPSRGL